MAKVTDGLEVIKLIEQILDQTDPSTMGYAGSDNYKRSVKTFQKLRDKSLIEMVPNMGVAEAEV